MSHSKYLGAVLAGVLSLSAGCVKAGTPDSPAAASKGGKGFSPQPPEVSSTGVKGDAVADAFEKAANRFSGFAAASPGERTAILRDGLPLLDSALKASDERIARDPKAVDFRTVAKLDGRFAEAWVWKDFRAVANLAAAKSGAMPLNVEVVYPNANGSAKMVVPPAPGSPAVVEQLTAKGAANAVAEVARLTKKNYDDLAFGNAVTSLLESAIKKKDYAEFLQLKAGDSLEEREQKVLVRAALDAFLGSVISYKESFFLAAERPSGLMEVWEFKQPIGMQVSRSATDAKTRLNSGVELTTTVEFSHDNPNDLCRKYLGGSWGSWGEFPMLGRLEITKDENWNVTFKSDLPFRSFHRLSSAEIDHALLKSGTTRAIAAAEKKLEAETAPPEAKLTMLSYYCAREDYEKAHALAATFLEFDALELPVTKRVATALLGEVALTRPAIGEAIKSGVAFKYYASYKGLNPEIGEMQRLPYPRRLGKGYFYGEEFDLTECIKAFDLLCKADPDDADNLFDLALLEMFGTERFKKPLETGNDQLERAAASHLSEAVTAAAKAPPKSGRNFQKLITEEPTFIVLQGQEKFERLLGKLLGGNPIQAPLTYGRKFKRESDYLNAGY